MTETAPPPPQRPADEGPSVAIRVLRVFGVFVLFFAVAAAVLFRGDESVESLRASYGGPKSAYATIDGMEVHYRDEGSGPRTPLLLLHGTSSSLHTWDGWVARLGTDRRVIRLDLPAFGLTGPRPDGDYKTTTYVDFLLRFLDLHGLERVDVAGNSFGGKIAWALAALHPERVRRLVLVDPAGLPGMKRPPMFRLAATPLSGLIRWCTPDFIVRNNLEQVYGDDALIEDALVERHARLLRRTGNRQALIDRILTGDPPSLSTRLRDIRAKTLILWGEADTWIPLEFAYTFRDTIPDAKLITYPGVGHVPMEEDAEETARDARRFLDSGRD